MTLDGERSLPGSSEPLPDVLTAHAGLCGPSNADATSYRALVRALRRDRGPLRRALVVWFSLPPHGLPAPLTERPTRRPSPGETRVLLDVLRVLARAHDLFGTPDAVRQWALTPERTADGHLSYPLAQCTTPGVRRALELRIRQTLHGLW